jgi:hypothetical protein
MRRTSEAKFRLFKNNWKRIFPTHPASMVYESLIS